MSTSDWESILEEVGADGLGTTHSVFRIVLVGPPSCGKRTLALRLRDSLSSDRRVSSTPQRARSGGIDYLFTELRVRGGSGSAGSSTDLHATVEFVSVDLENLLEVALPSIEVAKRSAVVIVADGIHPQSLSSDVARWRDAVNARFLALGVDAVAAVSEVDSRLEKSKATFAKFSPPESEQAHDASSSITLRTMKTMSFPPTVLCYNKMDVASQVVEALSSSPEVSAPGGTKLTTTAFVHQTIRKCAQSLGASLALASAVRTRQEHEGLYRSIIVTCLTDLGAPSEMIPNLNETVEERIQFEFTQAAFIPAGIDTPSALAKVVRVDAVRYESIFTSTEMKKPKVDSHQQAIGSLVSDGAMWDEIEA